MKAKTGAGDRKMRIDVSKLTNKCKNIGGKPKKKCDGEGLMKFEKQKKYIDKKKKLAEKAMKKKKDRLRYLKNKEKKAILSKIELIEKLHLEQSL